MRHSKCATLRPPLRPPFLIPVPNFHNVKCRALTPMVPSTVCSKKRVSLFVLPHPISILPIGIRI